MKRTIKIFLCLFICLTALTGFSGCSETKSEEGTTIIGTWVFENQDAKSPAVTVSQSSSTTTASTAFSELAYVFDKDNYFYMFQNGDQISYGTYEITSDVITLYSPDKSQSSPADYTIKNNVLTITADSKSMSFKRSDKKFETKKSAD